MTTIDDICSRHSPGPWAYEYSPYALRSGEEPDRDLPAFEVFDANGIKLFDTNEDRPADIQEADARLAALAPELLAAFRAFAAVGDGAEAVRQARALLARITQTLDDRPASTLLSHPSIEGVIP